MYVIKNIMNITRSFEEAFFFFDEDLSVDEHDTCMKLDPSLDTTVEYNQSVCCTSKEYYVY